jgi:minimal PKS chain-length factor (CLF/KS beta)
MDGSLCPYGLAIQIASKSLSSEEDPGLAFLPFDERASGYLPGEGGAILVAENGDAAADRGAATVYGAIAGYGAAFDPEPGSCGGLIRAAQVALRDAEITTSEIDVVFADAAGQPAADLAEADAITQLFGPQGVAVCAPKTMTGRLLSGGAALDTASALLSIRDGVLPPAINIKEELTDQRLDLVIGTPRKTEVGAALILARGHGGFVSAVIVTRP